jgi:hypothetical protein
LKWNRTSTDGDNSTNQITTAGDASTNRIATSGGLWSLSLDPSTMFAFKWAVPLEDLLKIAWFVHFFKKLIISRARFEEWKGFSYLVRICIIEVRLVHAFI